MRLNVKQWIAIACCAWVPLSAGAASYTVVDLGTLGGSYSSARAINPSGWVTGQSNLPGDSAQHAFLWNGTTMLDLGTLGGNYSFPTGLNANGLVTGYASAPDTSFRAFTSNGGAMLDLGTLGGSSSTGMAVNINGYVTGYSHVAGNTALHAFTSNGGIMQDLGTLGGTYSEGRAINDSGWITGGSQVTGNSGYHAFISNGGAMLDLGTLGGTHSFGQAINANGWVTGNSQMFGNNEDHAFLWNGTTMQDLGTLGGSYSFGYGINAAGSVIGYSSLSGNSGYRAFISNGGVMQNLGTLGGNFSYALAINASGSVVGHSLLANGALHAFLWDGTGMIDLNTLLPAGTPFVLSEAQGINDSGQIVAYGVSTITGEGRALLLSPAPQFTFTGFFAPVDNAPATNVLKAGQAVPVKFSLGGDKGLDIFASGYPLSQSVTCGSLGSPDDIEQTVTAGASALQYDAAKDQYTYVWKTVSTWANTCRTLVLKLSDGTQQVANFQFKK